jgi:glycosyltransferase involved in cell wall biosynthesis
VRILVVSNVYPPDVLGGYELLCRQAVDALLGRGHDVLVLTSAPRTPVAAMPHVRRALRLTDVWSQYSFQRSAPVTAHLDQAESHRINAFNVHALLDALAEFAPDVVYLHMLVGLGGLGLLACLEYLRIPWVWHLGDDVPLRLCEAAGRTLNALVREYNRRIEGHYIAVSRQLADAIEAGGIELRGTLEILPYWVAGPEAGQPWTQSNGTLRVVAAAAVIDRQIDKGIDLAIEALALLRQSGRARIRLDVYGQVTDSYFPGLALKRGVRDIVHFHGPLTQHELTSRYLEHDIFLFPTRPGEPFGVAPLEAAARGCVPLMSHTCGLAEWLVHGVHCLKAPRRVEAFAASLAAVLDGTIDLDPIRRRLPGIVRLDFHLDVIIPRIEAVLRSAAGRSRAGAGTPEEAYRLALLAEKLTRVLVQESLCA